MKWHVYIYVPEMVSGAVSLHVHVEIFDDETTAMRWATSWFRDGYSPRPGTYLRVACTRVESR